MATIDSVELYLGLSSSRSGWDIVVKIEDFGAHNATPEDPPTQGTKSLDVSNVPLISGPGAGWVVFTFDTPITISEDGFVGLLVTTTAPSAFQATPLRWFYAQNYTYASSAPWDGTERFYRWTSGGGWVDPGSAVVLAYKINCTGSTDNDATNPSGSYYNFGNYAKMGHRSYMDAAPSAPGKPTIVSPTPTGVTGITLDETPLEWAAGDPAGDTYEIYWRIQGDDWVLVGIAQAGVEWTIDFGTLVYGVTYEWRIDATNTAGTTTGDTWSFSSIDFDQIRVSYRLIGGGNGRGPYDSPPGVQGTDWEYTGESNMITVRKLIAAANNKIWHEDI